MVALPQEGTIIRVGTHSELLATVPEYRELLSAYDAEQGMSGESVENPGEEVDRDRREG